MRIAMLAPRPSVRGPLPKHTPLLADGLRRLGCEVVLLPWGRTAEAERLPAKLLSRARDVLSARRAIVEGRFPVVVVKTAHDWLTLSRDLALLTALPRDRVVVLQFHGSQSQLLVGPGSRTFKRATGALLARADGVLVLSNEERTEWERFRPSAHVIVVRNPRPPLPKASSAEHSRDTGERVILYVGRLIEDKGVLDLVRALDEIRKAVPSRLVLAGDGPERDRLDELATDLGLRDWVDLPGYLEGTALSAQFARADVFVLPTSHNEGFPTVILEAMAAQLPIVTTPTRGAVDHLIDGENVLYAPPRDPSSLAAAVTRMLTDADLATRIAVANLEKVRDFDADRVAADYLVALEKIVDARDRH